MAWRGAKPKTEWHQCEECHQAFQGQKGARYCSPRCRKRASRKCARLVLPAGGHQGPYTWGLVCGGTGTETRHGRQATLPQGRGELTHGAGTVVGGLVGV